MKAILTGIQSDLMANETIDCDFFFIQSLLNRLSLLNKHRDADLLAASDEDNFTLSSHDNG